MARDGPFFGLVGIVRDAFTRARAAEPQQATAHSDDYKISRRGALKAAGALALGAAVAGTQPGCGGLNLDSQQQEQIGRILPDALNQAQLDTIVNDMYTSLQGGQAAPLPEDVQTALNTKWIDLKAQLGGTEASRADYVAGLLRKFVELDAAIDEATLIVGGDYTNFKKKLGSAGSQKDAEKLFADFLERNASAYNKVVNGLRVLNNQLINHSQYKDTLSMLRNAAESKKDTEAGKGLNQLVDHFEAYARRIQSYLRIQTWLARSEPGLSGLGAYDFVATNAAIDNALETFLTGQSLEEVGQAVIRFGREPAKEGSENTQKGGRGYEPQLNRLRNEVTGMICDADHWLFFINNPHYGNRIAEERRELVYELTLARLNNQISGKGLEAAKYIVDENIRQTVNAVRAEQGGRSFLGVVGRFLLTAAQTAIPGEPLYRIVAVHGHELFRPDRLEGESLREVIRVAAAIEYGIVDPAHYIGDKKNRVGWPTVGNFIALGAQAASLSLAFAGGPNGGPEATAPRGPGPRNGYFGDPQRGTAASTGK